MFQQPIETKPQITSLALPSFLFALFLPKASPLLPSRAPQKKKKTEKNLMLQAPGRVGGMQMKGKEKARLQVEVVPTSNPLNIADVITTLVMFVLTPIFG